MANYLGKSGKCWGKRLISIWVLEFLRVGMAAISYKVTKWFLKNFFYSQNRGNLKDQLTQVPVLVFVSFKMGAWELQPRHVTGLLVQQWKGTPRIWSVASRHPSIINLVTGTHKERFSVVDNIANLLDVLVMSGGGNDPFWQIRFYMKLDPVKSDTARPV